MTGQKTRTEYPTLPPCFQQSDIRLPEPPRSAPLQQPASPGLCHEVRPLFSSSSLDGRRVGSSTTTTGSRSNGEVVSTADTSLGSADSKKSRLAELIIAEIDAEIEASQHTEQQSMGISPASDVEIQNTSLAITNATSRIQRFRASYEYIAYRSDIDFKVQLAKTYRSLAPVRANGRIAAFEHSLAYIQYLEDMELVRLHGNEYDAPMFEVKPKSMVGDKRKRKTGDWIRQWCELGVGGRKNFIAE